MEPHIIRLCSWSLYLYLNLKSFIVIITYYYHCLIAFVWNCAIQINHWLFHEFIIIYNHRLKADIKQENKLTSVSFKANSKGNLVITSEHRHFLVATEDRTRLPSPSAYTYIVLRGATDAAWLALYALPLVRPHCLHHVVSELQTRGVTCGGTRRRNWRSGVSRGVSKGKSAVFSRVTAQGRVAKALNWQQTKADVSKQIYKIHKKLIYIMCSCIRSRLWDAAMTHLLC